MEKKILSASVTLILVFGAAITDSSLFELQQMIKQVTGKSAVPNYTTYGCYCGWGGKGEPLDDTDRCCRDHDCCYRQTLNCRPKSTTYSYTYLFGHVSCGSGTRCQMQTCECDRNFVLCLKKHLGSYKNSYRFYRNKFCGTSKPRC